MDRPGMPEFVVEYVLYHEMLHGKHPTRRPGCSLISHSPEFRAEEKHYERFRAARKFLDRLAGKGLVAGCGGSPLPDVGCVKLLAVTIGGCRCSRLQGSYLALSLT